MTLGHARYSDGRFLGSIPVTFTITADRCLRIEGEDVLLEVETDDVRTSERVASVPTFIYLPDGGVLETHDHEACDALAARNAWAPLARLIHGLEGHSTFAAVATFLVVAFVCTGLYLGLPSLARDVAMRVPESIDKQAGAAALAAIDAHVGRSSLEFWQQQRVRRQFGRLYPDRESDAQPRIEFRNMGDDMINAFALPGNIIIVTDALVAVATDDELAAVLAHEAGHLEHRHALQGLLRRSFALLFVTAAAGDLSALTSVAATIPFVILNNGYSRDLEREADTYALALLEQRGIDTRHFSSLLMKIESAHPGGRRFTYLDTHPSTEERIARFRPPIETPAEAAPTNEPAGVSPISAASLLEINQRSRQSMGDRFGNEEIVINTDAPAKVIHQVPPKYPKGMRSQGVTGEVLVSFIVDRNGRVRQPSVLKSAGPEFDQAALAAVSRWRFLPAMKHGVAVTSRLSVPIVFSIVDEPPEPPLRAEDFIPLRKREFSP